MSYITPRIWLFLVKLVNISTITLEIWDHYYYSFPELGISDQIPFYLFDSYFLCYLVNSAM